MSLITATAQRPLLADLDFYEDYPDTELKKILMGAVNGPNWQKNWKSLGAKTALSLCGVAGRVAYLPQMQRLANGNLPLSIFFQAMSLPVYSTDYAWASTRMVNEIQARQLVSSQEVADTGASCSKKCCKAALQAMKVAVPIILGALAQTPLMALALKYNPDNPAMVALTTMDAVLPIYSIYVLLSLWSQKCQGRIESPRSIQLSKLEQLKQDLLLSKPDRLSELLDESSSENHKVDSLYRLLNEPLEEAPTAEASSCKQASILAAKGSGLLLTAFYLAWLGVFTYEGAAHFSNDRVIDSMVTIFAVAVNAALMGTLFMDTHLQIVESIDTRIQKKPSITFISETVAPSSSTYVKLACVAFVLFQSMAAIQISRDYLPSEYVIPNAVVLSLAFAIPAYFPVRQLTDWGLQELYLKRGTPEQKKIINLYQTLDRLSMELSHSSPPQAASELELYPVDTTQEEV
ncbi:MAG: hypothetical protein NTX49_02225 [Chlamydiae bacterium]|nr:hypothetical protein [Chlamydiota bacterium]